MNCRVEWIDVAPSLASGEQPVVFLPRPTVTSALVGSGPLPRTGRFWVPMDALTNKEPRWALTEKGDAVRIPVAAYRTGIRTEAAIFSLGLYLGCLALTLLRRHVAEDVQEVTLVLGRECTDLGAEVNAWRCYAGLALRTG